MECNNTSADIEQYCPFHVSSQADYSIPKKSVRESISNGRIISSTTGSKEKLSDRYIPCRHTNFADKLCDAESHNELESNSPQFSSSEEGDFVAKREENLRNYSQLLESKLLGDDDENTYWQLVEGSNNIPSHSLKLKRNAFRYKREIHNPNPTTLGFGFDTDRLVQSDTYIQQRKINKLPYKVLDAPGLIDDFYLNLLDWSSQNLVSVGLESAVYVWSGCTSRVTKLLEVDEDTNEITSVAWNGRGHYLAVGLENGEMQIWDVHQQKQMHTLKGHTGRVSAISWCDDFISTGSKDRTILHYDLRSSENFFSKLEKHSQEVCGLKWSFDGVQLASGGNDNKLCVWDARKTLCARLSAHRAAVKALAWSPHERNLLVSGGGTADRRIKFWNTLTNECIKSIDTGSQVCNLMFSKNVNELVSTHGYSLNQINIWSYPRIHKIATLTGHTYRVLYLSMSPNGESIVTGAGDETLRFWNIFPPIKSRAMNIFGCSSGLIPSSMDIR